MNIQKYLDLFEYQKEEDSTNPKFKEGFWSFKPEAIGESKLYEKLVSVMRESGLDLDSQYNFTVEALEAMKEIYTSGFDLENPESFEGYSEAPIYTSELMEWISKGSNYSYGDEVLKEYGSDIYNESTGILGIISMAYSTAWGEHYYKVLEAIKD